MYLVETRTSRITTYTRKLKNCKLELNSSDLKNQQKTALMQTYWNGYKNGLRDRLKRRKGDISVIKFLEAVFAIIGVLATLFVVAVAVSGDNIVKYLEETAQKLQERAEQHRKEKESK